MIKLIHSLLQFIGANIISILIWAWMIWITVSILEVQERLDKVDKDNRSAIELTEDKDSAKPVQPIPRIHYKSIFPLSPFEK